MQSAEKEKKWRNEEPPRKPQVSLYEQVCTNDWDNIPHIHKGIANFGNTCFLNATIQILFHTPNIVRWLQTSDHLAECHMSLTCILCHMIKTFRHFKSCRDPQIRPAAFAAVTRKLFAYFGERDSQEDAHECLVLLLKQMEERFLNTQRVKWSDAFSTFTNPVFRIFGGWLITKCVCPNCLYMSKTYSPFTSLSIDIKNMKSVQEAISVFFMGEKVEDYTCCQCSKLNNCVTKRTCHKSFSLHEAPSSLILQLNRFEQDRSKLEASINVDQEILAMEHSYKLAGAVLHSGPSSNSGHYFTIVQCPDEAWMECNDSKVTKVNYSYVERRLQESAYILFYRRTDPESSPLDDSSSPKKIVSPMTIAKRKKIGPKENSTVSSNDYIIVSSTFNACGNSKGCFPSNGGTDDVECASLGEVQSPQKFVSPINIRRQKRTLPKENSTVSSNDYIILSQTHQDFSRHNRDSNDLGCAPLVENVIPDNFVSPIKIAKRRKELPKENSTQSSHDYFILSQTHNVYAKGKELSAGGCPYDEGFHDNQSSLGSPKDGEIHDMSNDDSHKDDLIHDPDYSDVGSCNDDHNISHHECLNMYSAKDEGFHERHMDGIENMFSDSPSKVPFAPLVLTENDVDGAILPRKPLASNTTKALKRWLECREGISSTGTKAELVERVAMVIARGNSHIIDPKVDGGKWYKAKAAATCQPDGQVTMGVTSQSQNFQMTQATLELPTNQQWNPFPSVDLPTMFNFGHIFFYLVESCPTMPSDDNFLDSDCSDDSDCDHLPDPFDDEHQTINEVKMLRKGLRFFKSKFVRGLQDCLGERCYFLKCQVRASMPMKAYQVTVAISKRSGSIHKCTCQCVQQALGRCVHVSTVLLHVWSHIRLNGYGGEYSKSFPVMVNPSYKWGIS